MCVCVFIFIICYYFETFFEPTSRRSSSREGEGRGKYCVVFEINVKKKKIKKSNLIFLLRSILTESLVTASRNNNILFCQEKTCG